MAGTAGIPVGAAGHVSADNRTRLALETEQRLAEQDLNLRTLVDPGRVRGPAELAARAAAEFLRPSVAYIGNALSCPLRISLSEPERGRCRGVLYRRRLRMSAIGCGFACERQDYFASGAACRPLDDEEREA
jgi:hypothetical protein